MSKNFQPLSSGEVLSVSNDSQNVIGHSTFRVSEFTVALKKLMLEHGLGGVTPENIDWLNSEGVPCDVLKFGSQGWVKGKVRLHLEFAEDDGAEASPDPKTEAAADTVTSVAATPIVAEPAPVPVVAEEPPAAFDLDFDEPEEVEVDAKDTLVQGDDDSFDDLFAGDQAAAEAAAEIMAEDIDDDFDLGDGFADLSVDEEGTEAAAIASDEESLLAGLDDDLDLFEDEPVEAEPEAIAPEDENDDLDLDLGLDDDPLDDPFADDDDDELDLDFELEDTDEATPAEPEAKEDGLDLEEDDLFGALDDPFAEEAAPVAEADSLELDDDLLVEDDAVEAIDEEDLGLGDILAEADDLGDADLGFDDVLKSAADDDDLGLDLDDALEPADDDDGLGLDLTADDDDLGLDLDDALGVEDESDLEALLTDDEPLDVPDSTPAPADETEDDLELDNLFDESEEDSDKDLFDDPFEEAAPEIAEALEEGDDDDFLLGDDDSLFQMDFDEAESTEISSEGDGDSAEPVLDLGGAGGDEDFSFDAFDEPSEISRSAPVDDDVANLLFESDDEDADNAVPDLTEDELPPEIDFGSTEDLGEFIDVSIMKKKMPAPVTAGASEGSELDDDSEISPFDLGDDSELLNTSDDDDISLGELFDSNDDDGFDFAALSDDDDPLDAVTGDEDQVSANVWDLE